MLLCLNGAPRAGKTFLSDYLVGNLEFRRVNLAFHFKKFVARSLDLDMGYLESIKDQDLFIDNSYVGAMANPPRRRPPLKVRNLFIEAADLIENVDPAVWVRRAVEELNISKHNYVLDSVGKREQWAWLISEYKSEDLLLWKVINRDSEINLKEYEDGRHSIEIQDFTVPYRHDLIYNPHHDDKYRMEDRVTVTISESLRKFGVLK